MCATESTAVPAEIKISCTLFIPQDGNCRPILVTVFSLVAFIVIQQAEIPEKSSPNVVIIAVVSATGTIVLGELVTIIPLIQCM